MKILITGGAGLLGQKLIAQLSANPAIDLVATAKSPASENNGCIQALDITNRDAVRHTISTVKPDAVIHAAAMTQVDQCEQDHQRCQTVNALAVESLTMACKKARSHFILVSTDFIFDGQRSPLEENALPNPINYYGKTKLEAENIVQHSGIPHWSIVRTALVYGVAPLPVRQNIVLWVKASLEHNKTIHVVNDQWRTPTLAEDLADGCYRIARNRAQGIYHIAGDDVLTPHAIAMRTAQFFELNTALIHPTDSASFTQLAKRPKKTVLTTDKAKRELGYRPHTFQQGLQTIAAQLTGR